MPSTSQQISNLTKAAKEHNARLSEHDLTTIKTAPADSPLSQWLNNFDPSKLLSPEELQFWHYIQNTDPPISNVHPPPTGTPTDAALRDAISNLEASTRRLEAQTETLNHQHALLDRHSKQAHQQRSQVATQVSALHRKSTLQAQHVHFANDAKASDLKSRLRSRLEQLEKEARGLQPRVTEKFKGHDGVLDQLQSTLNDGASNSEQGFTPEDERPRVEQLLKALKKARVAEIKDRLDRVYLEQLHRTREASDPGEQDDRHDEALVGAGTEPDQQRDPEDAVVELREEIQSLYEEITDVAGMLVEHEHGVPLRTSLAKLTGAEEERKNRVLSEATEKITAMTGELEVLTREMEEKRSERIVLARMTGEVARIQKEMNVSVTASRPTRTAAPGETKALIDLMDHLKLQHAGNLGQDNENRAGPEPFIQRLESTAQQRRQAVTLLLDAANTTTDAKEGLEALEQRIAEARAELEG